MVDFSDEAKNLEQKAKDEGWDKKAEEDIKGRFEKKNTQQQGQQGDQSSQ